MALGLLRIPKREFLGYSILEVYYILKAEKDKALREENDLRRLCFHQVAPHWSGKMPLRHLWQLWEIPEIDGDVTERIKFTTVRKATPEEMALHEKLTKRR